MRGSSKHVERHMCAEQPGKNAWPLLSCRVAAPRLPWAHRAHGERRQHRAPFTVFYPFTIPHKNPTESYPPPCHPPHTLPVTRRGALLQRRLTKRGRTRRPTNGSRKPERRENLGPEGGETSPRSSSASGDQANLRKWKPSRGAVVCRPLFSARGKPSPRAPRLLSSLAETLAGGRRSYARGGEQ